MALINIQANFSVLLSTLDRIATALERAVGPVPGPLSDGKKRGPESIVQYGNGDREWAKEHFRKVIKEQGHAPEREEALLNVALKRYDYETKHPQEEL